MADYIVKYIIYSAVLSGIIGTVLCGTAQLLWKRFGARWGYVMTIIAIAAFILPIVLIGRTNTVMSYSNTYTENEINSVQNSDIQTESTNADAAAQNSDNPKQKIQGMQTVDSDTEITKNIKFTEKKQIDVYMLILAVYLLLTVLLIFKQTYSYILFSKKAVKLSAYADNELAEAVKNTAENMGFKRNIDVRTVRAEITPFVTGIIRPTLYLSEDGVTEFSLRHELTHCKRCDLLFKLMADIICTVQFFNPAAYFLRRTLDKLCELSCDEAVTKNMDMGQRRSYSIEILTLAKRSCPKISGRAALCERKSDLTRRIESIMKYQKRSFFTRILSIITAIAVMLGGTVFAAEGAQRVPKLKKAVYTGNIQNFNFSRLDENGDIIYDDKYSSSFDTVYENGVCVYTDFLGKTSFKASWLGFNAETKKNYEELINREYTNEEWTAYINNAENYSEFCETELTRVVRRYGDNVGIEGLFDIRRNNETVIENAKGYIVNPPPAKEYSWYDTPQCIILFEENGVTYNMTIDMSLEEREDGGYKKAIEPSYYMNHSIKTAELEIGEVKRLIENGKECNVNVYNEKRKFRGEKVYSGSIQFNSDMKCAIVSLYFDNYHITMRAGTPITCTDDSVTGEFIVEDNSAFYAVDAIEATLSGLSSGYGGTITFKSKNGDYEMQAVINPYETPKCRLNGTREPSEFYTEGEEVFIGTPYEQDEYDKIHFGEDKKVKRIVVDDSGKVVYVAPVEWQTAPNVIMQEGEPYTGCSDWQGVGGVVIVNADGSRDTKRKILIWDSYKSEAVAVIPPELQFWTEDSE